jgi:hypothetical protein
MERIKVLLIEPMEKPRLVEVEDTLENLQCLVDGDITAAYPWEDPVALVCNDNGIAEGLMLNRVLEDYDIILGSFFICGLDDEKFVSIPDALIPKYIEKFHWPEVFLRSAEDEILCFRMTDSGMEVHPFGV